MVRVSHSRPAVAEKAARRRRRLRRIVGVLVLVPVAVLLLLIAALGVFEPLQNDLMRRSGATSVAEVLQALVNAPIQFVQASTRGTAPLRLGIDIKFKHLYKIHERRAEALEAGFLAPAPEDYVPASIDVAGQTIHVKMRLAGGPAEFLKGEKWPLDVRLRGEGHVFGMRRFVLRPPEQRGFQSEALFLSHLRKHDVLAPRFYFVDISLNGKDIGLMAIEEFFSRELLESQKRRDGPVLRLRPASKQARSEDARRPAGLRFDPTIEPLRPRQVANSGSLTRSFELARDMLRAYLVGKLSASDVFDVAQTARYLAIAELWGARHALDWRNLRFYFNPLTARLEPVGYAAQLQQRESGDTFILADQPFVVRLLEDARMRSAVRDALMQTAQEMQSPDFALEVEQQQDWLLGQLHREYPMRVAFAFQPLLARVAELGQRELLPDLAAPPSTQNSKRRRLTPLPETSVPEVLTRHPFLRWNEQTGYFSAPVGRWNVDDSLILPEGAGLELAAGTILHFEKREGIIARGPLRFLGTKEAPVVLEGPSSHHGSQLWSGVYVIASERESRWSHVAIRNTGGFKRGNWRLAGGVVFRKARIDMEHTSFHRNLTDDSLNVVRTTFQLDHVEIHDAYSDALDGDYVDGEIRNSLFSNAGGDGVDFGGSNVRIQDTRFRNIRDKALAIGEHSRLQAMAIDVDGAGIGVASKNGATTHIEASTLRNITDVALAAYMNRAQFGPGRLHVVDTRIEGAPRNAVAQSGSEITIDGQPVAAVNAAIDLLHKDSDLDRRGAH